MRKLLFSVLILVGGLIGAPAVQAQDAPTQIKGATTVDADKLIALVSGSPELVIVDNRRAEDFAAGRLEGAVRVLDTDLTPEVLAQHVKSKDTPVLFYCNGLKCGRAAKATEKAVSWGYSKVYYYANGMDEWRKKDLPMVKG